MYFSDGDKYQGSFVDNNFDGEGTVTWANGDSWTGPFVKGNKHGKGMYTWADGDKEAMEWKNDT